MPVPNFMRYVNKRFFNRMELAQGKRPVLVHAGRVSGETYRTPLEAIRVDGGYVFILMYGADKTDWVKNVVAADGATVVDDGREYALVNPKIFVGEAAWAELPSSKKPPPGFFNVNEVLRMDVVADPPS